MQVLLHEALASVVSISIILLDGSALFNLSVDIIMISVVFVGDSWVHLLVDVMNIETIGLGVETEFLKDALEVLVDEWCVFKVPFLELLNSFGWDAQFFDALFSEAQKVLPGFDGILGRGLLVEIYSIILWMVKRIVNQTHQSNESKNNNEEFHSGCIDSQRAEK